MVWLVFKVGTNGAGSPLLPVMFFVHGGAFQGGHPRTYTGEYLLDENVLLVNVNYRLHSLGKFCPIFL